jgi:hypothetical protein
MKKLSLVLLIAVIGFSSGSLAQVSFGLKAGANLAKYSYEYKDSEGEPDVKMRLAPLAGLAINIQFSDQLALQSGLFYSGKGTSFDVKKMAAEDDIDAEGYWRYSTAYVELPVNVAFGFPIGDNQIQVYAGPYVAYGITGKEKMDFTLKNNGDEEPINEETNIKFKDMVDENDFEGEEDIIYQVALDYGLNFGLGFKTGPILVNAGYGMGFSNLEPKWGGEGEDTSADYKFTTRIINFSVSYFFGNKQGNKRGRYRRR